MADRYVIFGATYDGDGTSTSEATGATVTITIASPGVVTWNSHGLANNTVVYLETTGALPTGLSGTGTYYVRNAATNTFELSLTSGGASINTSGSQSGTHYASTAGAWRATNYAGTTLTSVVGTVTHGTLAAGDTVYIRSKTGNGANANISFTITANTTLGNASGTVASPITWILDDGTTWSGQNGTLTYTHASGSFIVSLRDYNRFIARAKHNFILECSATVPAAGAFALNASETNGLHIKQLGRQANLSGNNYGSISYDAGYHANIKVSVNRMWGVGNQSRVLLGQESSSVVGSEVVFDNPEFEITTAGTTGSIFGMAGYFGRTLVRGGRLFGDGATNDGVCFATPPTAATTMLSLEAVGFQIPKTCSFSNETATWFNASHARGYGLDDGTGSEMRISGGNADTRNYTANYPVLNATLADSAGSGCSWRITPRSAMWHTPMEVVVAKLYTSTAGAKKVTMDLLVSDNWGAGVINRHSVWMTVAYVDNTTGNMVTETTRLALPGTDLDANSGAGWGATSWGLVNFTGTTNSHGKRKLELTTAGSIKQDTAVIVTFNCTAKCVSTTYDIFIVDPDVQLSTP